MIKMLISAAPDRSPTIIPWHHAACVITCTLCTLSAVVAFYVTPRTAHNHDSVEFWIIHGRLSVPLSIQMWFKKSSSMKFLGTFGTFPPRRQKFFGAIREFACMQNKCANWLFSLSFEFSCHFPFTTQYVNFYNSNTSIPISLLFICRVHALFDDWYRLIETWSHVHS